MKRENIIQRIKNFFDNYIEPNRTKYIFETIHYFDVYRSILTKDICDSKVVKYAIERTIIENGL